MPLDRTRARSDAEGARNAYRSGPRADFIQRLAEHVDEALKVVDSATLEASQAKNECARLGRELDEEKTAYRKLREQGQHMEACVALLRELRISPKGAQRKAADMLERMGVGVTETPAVTASVVPDKVEVP